MNNYKAVNFIEKFREQEITPLEKKIELARNIMADKNYKWSNQDQKKAAEKKLEYLVEKKTYLERVCEMFYELARDHESLTDEVISHYLNWHKNVSYNGVQQKEMMQQQADILQEIFQKIYDRIKVLNEKEQIIPKPNK